MKRNLFTVIKWNKVRLKVYFSSLLVSGKRWVIECHRTLWGIIGAHHGNYASCRSKFN